MGDLIIVRIRRWLNQEDCEDDYYELSAEDLKAAQRARAADDDAPVLSIIVERGRKIEPALTVERDDF